MCKIAEQLDAKLKSLDAKAASALEQLVRDAIHRVDSQNGGSVGSTRLPADFFTRIAHEFGSELFERPAQGETERRKTIDLCH